jgi:hypothetical protein
LVRPQALLQGGASRSPAIAHGLVVHDSECPLSGSADSRHLGQICPTWTRPRHRLAPGRMRHLLPHSAHLPRPGSGARPGQVGCCSSSPSCAPPASIVRDPAATPTRPSRPPPCHRCRYPHSPPSLPSHRNAPSLQLQLRRRRRRLTYPNIKLTKHYKRRSSNKRHDAVGDRCGKLPCSVGAPSANAATAT